MELVMVIITTFTSLYTYKDYMNMEEEVSEKDCTSFGWNVSLVFISKMFVSRVKSFIAAGHRTGASQTCNSVWICGTNGLKSDSKYIGKHSMHDPYDPSSGAQ